MFHLREKILSRCFSKLFRKAKPYLFLKPELFNKVYRETNYSNPFP